MVRGRKIGDEVNFELKSIGSILDGLKGSGTITGKYRSGKFRVETKDGNALMVNESEIK